MITAKLYLRILCSGWIIGVVLTFIGLREDIVKAQEIPPDAYQLGLEWLEPDQRGLWLSLKAHLDTVEWGEYLKEGEKIIEQMGELVRTTGGVAPRPGEPAYELYRTIQTRLSDLLDRIQVGLAAQLPVEELRALLDFYRHQKEEIALKTREERQKLLAAGRELMLKHSQDPLFTRYPHRRAILADLYIRLAELTYQEVYEQFLEESDRYFRLLDSLQKANPELARELKPPAPDYSPVRVMYQRILDEFADSPYADDALYNLALINYESSSQREREEGTRLLETLIRLYPESEYRLNSLRRIGEYYFNPPINNLDKAEQIYRQITKEFKGSAAEVEALYKLGWTYYRLNRLDDAVENFALALDASGFDDRKPREGQGVSLNIIDESINYICVCYAIDPKEWAGAGFGQLLQWLEQNPQRNERYGRRLLFQLGDLYYKGVGRYADAVEVYSEIVRRYPLHPAVWKVQENLVEIFQQGHIADPARAYQEKETFFTLFNPQSEWWKSNSGTPAIWEVTPILEKYLGLLIDETLALLSQDKGLRTSNDELWEKFERYSRAYLSLWPQGPNAYKVHYDLASALEKRPGREMDALKEFWQVATAYSDTSKREVATHRILALAQDLLKKERAGEIKVLPDGQIVKYNPHPPEDPPQEQAPGADTLLAPTPLLVSESILLAGNDLFLNFYPLSPYSPTILYQCGDILFKHNRFEQARGYLERLIEKFPDHQLVSDAYTLVLESYFKENNVQGVEEVVGRIEKAPVKGDLKELAKRRKAEAVFLKAAKLKEGEDHLSSAQEFLRVAVENPEYQYADRSLFQAGLEFNAAKEWRKAIECFTLLSDRYPKSEFADKALYNAAYTYQTELKDPGQAAKLYERLGQSYPKSELAAGALSNASYAYNQMGDHQGAIRANELYVSLFPEAEDASVYLFENAGHYLSLGLIDKANEIYRQFAQRYPDDPRTVQAYCERGLYFASKGDRTAASREFTATVEAHQRLVGRNLPGSPKYASIALAELLKWEQAEFEKLDLNVPPARLEEVKARKKQWRNALVDKYQQLIALGQKEAYQAFYLLGRMDENFALVQAALENPPGRTFQERQEALAKLIDEAIVLNSVAVETYLRGYQNLRTILEPLAQERNRRAEEYARFSQVVNTLQRDPQAQGVSDSLAKLNAMARIVSELDSALVEASRWADSCRLKVPEVSLRNGDYLTRLMAFSAELRSTDKDPIVRLLFRQEVVKNVLTPLVPEIVGYYGSSLLRARELGLARQYYPRVEKVYETTLENLSKHYQEQCDFAHTRLKGFIDEYIKVLPKGPDARTPSGYYPDEMGGVILDYLEYENTFLTDYLGAISAVLDTVHKIELPYGFGEPAHERILRYILGRVEEMEMMGLEAKRRQEEFARKYEETSGIEWDDASVAFEDLSRNLADYSRSILATAYDLRQKYALTGEASLAILKKIITLDPETYGSSMGLGASSAKVVTDEEWKVWHSLVDGFDQVEFDDQNWTQATISAYPATFKSSILDSLGAKPIWVKFSTGAYEPSMTPEVTQPPTPPDTAGELKEEITPTGEEGVQGGEPDALPPGPEKQPQEIGESVSPWGVRDSQGLLRYWFRRTFTMEQPPTYGEIWITADDDYRLFINGVFIAQDKSEKDDWAQVDHFIVTPHLHQGKNVVAVEVSEADSTSYGWIGALVYKYVPRLELEVERLIAREEERERKAKEEAMKWLSAGVVPLPSPVAITPVSPPSPPSPPEVTPEKVPEKPVGPSPEEVRFKRLFERKKLR